MITYKKLGYISQRGSLLRLRGACVEVARRCAPKDTGNLRQNAIYSVATRGGFKVVWDKMFAYYLPFVNEGKATNHILSKKQTKNIGFVDRGISAVISLAQKFDAEGIEGLKDIKRSRMTLKSSLPRILDNKLETCTGKNLTRLKVKAKESYDYIVKRSATDKEFYTIDENATIGYSNIKSKTGHIFGVQKEMYDITQEDIFRDILKKSLDTMFEGED